MKKIILPIALLMSLTTLMGCNSKKQDTPTGEDAVPQDPLDLGPDFNSAYYPQKENNRVASIVSGSSSKMRIDVALDFDGTEAGWQAIADEYMRDTDSDMRHAVYTLQQVNDLDSANVNVGQEIKVPIS